MSGYVLFGFTGMNALTLSRVQTSQLSVTMFFKIEALEKGLFLIHLENFNQIR